MGVCCDNLGYNNYAPLLYSPYPVSEQFSPYYNSYQVSHWPPQVPTHPPDHTIPPLPTHPTSTPKTPPTFKWPPAVPTHPTWPPQSPPQVAAQPSRPSHDTWGSSECGVKNGNPDQQKIVGGHNAELGEWPWMVSHRLYRGENA